MKKHTMGYKRLLIGFIFLLSPDISIFDLLPDFIGYALILSGLSRLADIDERAFDSRALAKRLFVLSIVKFIFGMSIGGLQKTNLLLVSFSLAVLDLILIIPFIKEFFHSLDYTATRHGINVSEKKNSELKTLSVFFFIVKDVLSTLPSFISLVDPSETGDYTSDLWQVDFSALFNVLTLLAFLIMALLFVFMTVKACAYFLPVCRNRELCESLYANYDRSVLQVPSRVISKSVKGTLPFITAAMIFAFDFYIDFIEVLPTAIAFLLIAIYSILASCRLKINTSLLTVVSVLGTIASVIALAYRVFWQRRLGDGMEYGFSGQAYSLVIGIAVLVLTSAVFLLLWISLARLEEKYLDGEKSSSTLLLAVAGVILAVFNFIIYTHPQYNPSFVFPNIIFSVFYVYVAIERVRSVSNRILTKYKKWDFN